MGKPGAGGAAREGAPRKQVYAHDVPFGSITSLQPVGVLPCPCPAKCLLAPFYLLARVAHTAALADCIRCYRSQAVGMQQTRQVTLQHWLTASGVGLRDAGTWTTHNAALAHCIRCHHSQAAAKRVGVVSV